MKFSVGYQYPDEDTEERFPEILEDYREHVCELYFAPGNEPGARSPAAMASGLSEEDAHMILMEDLAATRKMGIRLNLLFNANCLGAECISLTLQKRLLGITENLLNTVGLDSVTTASWFIAEILTEHFSRLEIRASVNMKIGSIEALNYAAERFDGFCIQRDINYHMDALQEIARWADANHKKLCLLANSGCLRNCAAQIFHDNLVAHLKDLPQEDCRMDRDPVFCRRFYGKAEHRAEYLAHSTFIRPEDINQYEGLVPFMKLATRTHCNPRLVLEAYTSGRFGGNLFDLTEPGHGIFFRGRILDNSRIPADYWKTRTHCRENCSDCGYCRQVLEQALISCEELK